MSKKKSVSNRPYESDVIKKFERDIEGGLFFNLSTLRSVLCLFQQHCNGGTKRIG
jgi:hypothetical protein